MNKNSQKSSGGENTKAKPDSAPKAVPVKWRVTADDDPQKEWDSDNPDDAFLDTEFAFDDGARKVVIQIIDS